MDLAEVGGEDNLPSAGGEDGLVRDTWGQKPLYLARWRKGWAFSSTIIQGDERPIAHIV